MITILPTQKFKEISKIFDVNSIDELVMKDLNRIKNNYYMAQVYEKRKIMQQLNEGFEKIQEAFQIVDDTVMLRDLKAIGRTPKTYKSYEDWYNEFVGKLERLYDQKIEDGTKDFTQAILYSNAFGTALYTEDFVRISKYDKNILTKTVLQMFFQNIINSDDPELKSLNDPNCTKLIAKEIDANKDLVYNLITPALLCVCSNELALKILNIWVSKSEEYIIDTINKEDEQTAINRDSPAQGGIYNWSVDDKTTSYYNFEWIKKSQVEKKSFYLTALRTSVSPFDITFKNVDRVHSLQVKGDVKFREKTGIAVKLTSAIIHVKDEDDIDASSFKCGGAIQRKILEKLKEYFIEVVEEYKNNNNA